MSDNKVSFIWSQMAQQKTLGLVKRLYSADYKSHLYATYKYPEGYCGIALSVSNEIKIHTSTFDALSELQVRTFEDSSFPDTTMLLVQLTDVTYQDVFAYLCENVITRIKDIRSDADAINSFLNTLSQWKDLFARARSKGLEPQEQQGLYGELSFLTKLIKSRKTTNVDAINYWVGSDRSLRDFQGANWAVEVKTTATNNPQKLTINGERQLDDTMIGHLYLFHCSVEVSKSTGETLPDRIKMIRNLIRDDMPALSLLNSKLFEAGYLDKQEGLYVGRTYKLRDERFFHVTGDFPRITEHEIREGVGDVKYGIVLSQCEPYQKTESQILNSILES